MNKLLVLLKKIYNDKKKLLLCVIGVIIVVTLLILIPEARKDMTNKKSNYGDYEVLYKDGKIIKYNNFKKPFTDTKTITIRNHTRDVKVYSIKWVMVNNTLKKQNKFLYELSCKGDGCAKISPSQIPGADSLAIPDIYLESGKAHEYTIRIKYTGSEKNVNFSGKLILEKEVTDQKKYEQYLRKRASRIQNVNESNNAFIDEDNKK